MRGPRGLVDSVVDCGPVRIRLAPETGRLDPSPAVHNWVNNGLGMSSRVYATGHTKDPVSFIRRSRVSCPGGRFTQCFADRVYVSLGTAGTYPGYGPVYRNVPW